MDVCTHPASMIRMTVLNSMLDNKDFLTRLLVGWRLVARQSEAMFCYACQLTFFVVVFIVVLANKVSDTVHNYVNANGDASQNSVMQICEPGPDSKIHEAHTGPIWVLSAPDGPHVGHMNLAF